MIFHDAQLELIRLADRRAENVGPIERALSFVFGARSLLRGLSHKGPLSFLSTGTGAYLLYRALTGRCSLYRRLHLVRDQRFPHPPLRRSIRVGASTTIDAPLEEVYHFWRELERLAPAIEGVRSVRRRNETTSEWTAEIAGKTHSWTSRILEERECRRIVWETLPEGSFDHRGSVDFLPAPGGRGTLVVLDVTWFAPPLLGPVARSGLSPVALARRTLRCVKQLIEAGEIARSGDAVRACRPAVIRPQQRRRLESERVDLASEDSFPASDPPSWVPVTSVGPSASAPQGGTP
jgi:uncharacterized membrane protein